MPIYLQNSSSLLRLLWRIYSIKAEKQIIRDCKCIHTRAHIHRSSVNFSFRFTAVARFFCCHDKNPRLLNYNLEKFNKWKPIKRRTRHFRWKVKQNQQIQMDLSVACSICIWNVHFHLSCHSVGFAPFVLFALINHTQNVINFQ